MSGYWLTSKSRWERQGIVPSSILVQNSGLAISCALIKRNSETSLAGLRFGFLYFIFKDVYFIPNGYLPNMSDRMIQHLAYSGYSELIAFYDSYQEREAVIDVIYDRIGGNHGNLGSKQDFNQAFYSDTDNPTRLTMANHYM